MIVAAFGAPDDEVWRITIHRIAETRLRACLAGVRASIRPLRRTCPSILAQRPGQN